MLIAWDTITLWTGFIANAVTIAVPVVAGIIFVSKRRTISAVLRLLVGYSYRLSFSELNAKIEKLSEMKVDDDPDEILNLMGDICGHMKGNPLLCGRLQGHSQKA